MEIILRSFYSRLRCTLDIYDKIDISKYTKLWALLKRKNDTYQAKKSKVLTRENIIEFFNTASDTDYLLMKVVTIFALHGACRRNELCNLQITDIQDTGKLLVVIIKIQKLKKIEHSLLRTILVATSCVANIWIYDQRI